MVQCSVQVKVKAEGIDHIINENYTQEQELAFVEKLFYELEFSSGNFL